MDKVLTVQEAAKLTGLTEQAIRCGLKAGKLPFGVAFRSDKARCWSYRIMRRRLERWMEGEL